LLFVSSSVLLVLRPGSRLVQTGEGSREMMNGEWCDPTDLINGDRTWTLLSSGAAALCVCRFMRQLDSNCCFAVPV